MRIINTAIMGSPVNWVKVPLMAATGMIALYLVTRLFEKPAAPAE